jgi:LmbE family N-acetylglucosaminyl deacetylase
MKVLVISAHHDDETFGAGGSLLKHVARGDEVYWLNFTETWDKYDKQRIDRARLQQTIARETGFSGYKLLGFPDGGLDTVPFRTLFDAAAVYLKQTDPDWIYTIGPGDIHPDHDIVYRLVMAITRPTRWKGLKILGMEIHSSTSWAWANKSNSFIPNIYNDITPYLDRKLEIASLYKDEMNEYPHARSLEAIKAIASYRGSSVGVRYAEAFMLMKEVIR